MTHPRILHHGLSVFLQLVNSAIWMTWSSSRQTIGSGNLFPMYMIPGPTTSPYNKINTQDKLNTTHAQHHLRPPRELSQSFLRQCL